MPKHGYQNPSKLNHTCGLYLVLQGEMQQCNITKLGGLTWISDTLTNVQKGARTKSGISFHSRYVEFILKRIGLQGNQTGRKEKQSLLPYVKFIIYKYDFSAYHQGV